MPEIRSGHQRDARKTKTVEFQAEQRKLPGVSPKNATRTGRLAPIPPEPDGSRQFRKNRTARADSARTGRLAPIPL